MKARKGEADAAFFGGFACGLVLTIIAIFATIDITSDYWSSKGWFENDKKIYKVTEYSKLEYPKKGVPNEDN